MSICDDLGRLISDLGSARMLAKGRCLCFVLPAQPRDAMPDIVLPSHSKNHCRLRKSIRIIDSIAMGNKAAIIHIPWPWSLPQYVKT
jgi:hypothetical protein